MKDNPERRMNVARLLARRRPEPAPGRANPLGWQSGQSGSKKRLAQVIGGAIFMAPNKLWKTVPDVPPMHNQPSRLVRPRRDTPFPTSPALSDSRRRFGRLRCEEVSCSLGAVLDLSAGGMRVASPKSKWFPLGDEVTVTLFGNSTSLLIRARIAWSRKTGWRTGEIGLMFLDMSPEARASLTRFAVAAAAQASHSSFAPARGRLSRGKVRGQRPPCSWTRRSQPT
jgi:hypothetical protein